MSKIENNNLHILLIRLSSMGDVLLASSAVAFLKKIYGESVKITFLTWDSYASILDGLPVERITFSKQEVKKNASSFYSVIEEMHLKDPFTLIWDLQGSWQSFKLRVRLGHVPSLVIDKRKWERFFLIFTKINFYKKSMKHAGSKHHVENMWNDFTAIFLDTKVDFNKRDFFLQKQDKMREKKVVILPSAAHPLKKWPVDNFLKVMQRLDEQLPDDIMFECIAGAEEKEAVYLGSHFNSCKNRQCKVLQSANLKNSLDEIMSAMLVISNDTGLMHQAWIYEVPLIGIFGPTSEHFGFSPFGENTLVKGNQTLWCRPCSVTGSGRCYNPNNHLCMKSIEPEDIVLSALEFLK